MNGIGFYFTIHVHYKFSCFGLGLTSLSVIFHNIMKIMGYYALPTFVQTIARKKCPERHFCPKLLVILRGGFLVNLRQTGVSKNILCKKRHHPEGSKKGNLA